MDALVMCECRHSIATHEDGRCAIAHCTCKLGSFSVLDVAIDRLKAEHGAKVALAQR